MLMMSIASRRANKWAQRRSLARREKFAAKPKYAELESENLPVRIGGSRISRRCLYMIRGREFFFFSSRRRHTRLQGDWSSDVCSSDLPQRFELRQLGRRGAQGLFDKHVLARAQGIARLAEVRIVERGDRDHLHRRVPQDGIEVARHAAARMLLRQAVGARGVEVMQPQHAGARVGGEGASMLFADAQTNDGDADHALPIDAAKAGTDC